MVSRISAAIWRCAARETVYRLAILLDNDGYYDQSDLLERDLMRPKLLRDFGWKAAFVLAKDWYEDRAAVLQRLDRLLAGEEPADDDEEDDEEDLAEDAGDEDVEDAFVELEAVSPVPLAAESKSTTAASGTPPPDASVAPSQTAAVEPGMRTV